MSPAITTGYFITLEGVDGCGKSTQAQLLADFLVKAGHQIVLTREPGGTALAEEIRRVILTPSLEELEPLAEILLYAAARAQHVNRVVRPALSAGQIVICERFIDSSLAYQGYGLGWDLKVIREVNRLAAENLEPSLTLLLDLETTESLKRLHGRTGNNGKGKDRIEQRGVEFQERVRQGFLALARNESRIEIVNVGHRSIKAIHSNLSEIVSQKLKIAAVS